MDSAYGDTFYGEGSDLLGRLVSKTNSHPHANRVVATGLTVAGLTKAVVNEAIEESWEGNDATLAKAAGVSAASLSDLRKSGANKMTSTLIKVCAALGISPKAATNGRLRYVSEAAKTTDPVKAKAELVALLREISGVDDPAGAVKVLRPIVELMKRQSSD